MAYMYCHYLAFRNRLYNITVPILRRNSLYRFNFLACLANYIKTKKQAGFAGLLLDLAFKLRIWFFLHDSRQLKERQLLKLGAIRDSSVFIFAQNNRFGAALHKERSRLRWRDSKSAAIRTSECGWRYRNRHKSGFPEALGSLCQRG